MLKTVLAAAILAIAPTFALAGGCNHALEQVSSCADGYAWDKEARACVELTTS